MKKELAKYVVVALVTLTLAMGGSYLWRRGASERKYREDIDTMRMIKEHLELELIIPQLRGRLAAAKKQAEAAMPTYTLTPEQRADKAEKLRQMNTPPEQEKQLQPGS